MYNFIRRLTIVWVFIFVSCKTEKKKIVQEKNLTSSEIQNQVDSINDISANEFARKYNAISGFDIDLGFTYQIEDSIRSSGKPISLIGQIMDIARKDSNMIFTINGNFSQKKCICEIFVTAKQFSSLSKTTKSIKGYAQYCFVFNLNKISSKSLLSINSDGEDKLSYNFHKQILIVNGNLIDMYKYKNADED